VKPYGFLKFRSKFVACGYSQFPDFDYDEKMDVSNAYVEAEIDKLIHMKFPKELFCDYEGNPIPKELLKASTD
jgi:hypothetical protein